MESTLTAFKITCEKDASAAFFVKPQRYYTLELESIHHGFLIFLAECCVCSKIILELYNKFRTAFLIDKIGRESLFKPILKSKSQDENNLNDDDDDDDDGSTDQTIDGDIPPTPNPRHGKIFIERDTLPHLSSNISFVKQIEPHRTVSFSLPSTTNSGHIRLRSSPLSFSKDNPRTSSTHIDPSDRSILRHKSVEFNLDSETTPFSTSPSRSTPSPTPIIASSTNKGPSPYATTYLTTKKRNEQEFAYIDDSNSSGSTTGRLVNATVVQQSQKPTTILTSTNPLFQRTHDV